MAGDELGSVILGVRVDASDATKGLAEVGTALDTVAGDAGDFDKAVSDAFGSASGAALGLGDDLKRGSKEGSKEIKQLAKDVEKASDEIKRETKEAGAKVVDNFEGMDGLKDTTGELDSTLKGLAGAIGVVSPEAEKLLMVTGDLSGGIEATTRLTKLLKTGLSFLVSPLGLVAGGVALAAAAFVIFKDDADEVEQEVIDLTSAMRALQTITDRLASVRLDIAVDAGEVSNIDASIIRMAESIEARAAPALAELGAAMGRTFDSASRSVGTTQTQLAALSGLLETGVITGEQYATMTVGLNSALDGANIAFDRMLDLQGDAGEAYRNLRAETDELISVSTDRIGQQAEAASADSAATLAAEGAAEAATARGEAEAEAITLAAAAAAVLAVNRQADNTLLSAADPLLAIFLERSQAIADMRTAGLTSERAHLLNLQNEVELEAGRAAALETTAEAVEALDPKIASLAIQSKAAATEANAHALAIENSDKILAASGVAMSGFFDLASQMSGENANELKALAIAETTINGLAAGIKAFAELGPVAGGIAAAGIAASTAAALMQIEGQAIPTMHSGGIVGGGVGDRTINAQSGEAVLNRQAVANIGGPRAVEDLNNSQSGGAGGGVVVNLSYRQRAFDSVVIDNLAKGGPLRSALNRAASKGRRRQGGVL